ncbi:MAG: YncE family protein [Acidobacteriota bacterium]
MLNARKIRVLILAAFSIMIVFRNYVIVIGQAPRPVLVALNKADSTLAVIDPLTMKVTGTVATGNSPHEVVLSADGLTAYVANYGPSGAPGSSFSMIDTAAVKEIRKVDLSPLMRPHGLLMIGGKLYFTAESNRAISRYDPAVNKVDWIMGTGQNGSHMVVGTADQKRFYTANIGSDSVSAFEFNGVPPAASKITHIGIGVQPEAIDLSPDGLEVWAGLNVEGAIDIVDTATNKFKEKVKINGRPYRVKFTPDGKRVIGSMVATRELLVIDAATRKEVRRIKLDGVPLGVVFSADSKTVFVSMNEPDAVIKLDLESGQIKGRAEIGKGPDGIALAGI